MLPGDGWVPRMSRPSARLGFDARDHLNERVPVAALAARAASRCSAPMISAISPSTALPPRSTRRSVTRPSAGFDASPDV